MTTKKQLIKSIDFIQEWIEKSNNEGKFGRQDPFYSLDCGLNELKEFIQTGEF